MEQEIIYQNSVANGPTFSRQGTTTPVAAASAADVAVQRERLLSAVPVELSVQLGSISVSASTLVDLAEGYDLDLRIDPSRPLLLTLGTEAVAEAVLTHCEDGEAQLRITRVFGESDETDPESDRLLEQEARTLEQGEGA